MMVVVLYASDQVQWNALLLINACDFETAHYLRVSLTQPGLFFLCFSHSRVVRCDFVES